MTARLLLASPDDAVVAEARVLVAEGDELEIVDVAGSAGEVMAALVDREVDVVVLHSELGPLPVLDLARELVTRFPDVGVVLMAREQTSELLRSALQAGVRGIVTLPLALEELQTTVGAAGRWSQAVRSRLAGEDEETSAGGAGTMIALGGAKGGVGTTTLAVHLALETARRAAGRSVCLVDFDLQTGDVRSLLDLTHRRSITDLVEVSDDLSARQLEDSLYLHGSGLRILLPPLHGELGEDVDGIKARRVLGAIRSRFDLVVVDLGATVTEASAVATEMADRVVLVTTPDVPSLRAANRLLDLWERLHIRKDDVHVVVNRASRDAEVQPDLVAKVVDAPLCKVSVPAAFRELEAAVNTGVVDRLEPDGVVPRAVRRLAEELAFVPSRTRGTRLSKRRARAAAAPPRSSRKDQSGQVMVEFMGLWPVIAVGILLLWQIVLAGYTQVIVGHAAREASRELAMVQIADDAEREAHLHEVAAADVPPAWVESLVVRNRDDGAPERVRVSLDVPLLVPGLFTSPFTLSSQSSTVLESAGEIRWGT